MSVPVYSPAEPMCIPKPTLGVAGTIHRAGCRFGSGLIRSGLPIPRREGCDDRMTTIQERAAILRMRQARDRMERVRRSTLSPATRLEVSRQDVLDISDGCIVRDDGHSSTVWVGSVGIAVGPETVTACRPDEAFLIRDGKRRKATTYTDARFPSGRVRNKARRLAFGQALLDALLSRRGGLAESAPERGLAPCAYVDTMAHGRSTPKQARFIQQALGENRGRIALLNGERFDTISGEFIDAE
jgi:hypothetical protein